MAMRATDGMRLEVFAGLSSQAEAKESWLLGVHPATNAAPCDMGA